MAHLDQTADYEIRVAGYVDHTVVDWFGPMQIEDGGDGTTCVTALTHIVTDQAGIVGLIRHLHGLGIVLLSIERHLPQG